MCVFSFFATKVLRLKLVEYSYLTIKTTNDTIKLRILVVLRIYIIRRMLIYSINIKSVHDLHPFKIIITRFSGKFFALLASLPLFFYFALESHFALSCLL